MVSKSCREGCGGGGGGGGGAVGCKQRPLVIMFIFKIYCSAIGVRVSVKHHKFANLTVQ